jgi:nucleotide-binding universal stress UspA family protein
LLDTREYAKAVTASRRVEARRNRWSRELHEIEHEERGATPRMHLFGPSAVERRRRALEHALDAAQAEGITVDEWFRLQTIDPALYERADWAGLNDELTVLGTRRGRHAA